MCLNSEYFIKIDEFAHFVDKPAEAAARCCFAIHLQAITNVSSDV